MAKYTEELYPDRLAEAHASGWRSDKWKGPLFRRIVELPWMSDGPALYDIVSESCCVPDAWRLSIEGSLFGDEPETLVLEFLIINLTDTVVEDRLVPYEALWWSFEGAERMHFRVLCMDRFGVVTPLITEDTMDPVSGLRKPPYHEF